jgi:chemotaxis protein methyltransferase CheR
MSSAPERRASDAPAALDEERRYRAILEIDPAVPASTPLLLERLDDPSWRVRSAVAQRLARSDPSRAVPGLVAALGPDGGVGRRNAAAAALVQVGAPALPALLAALGGPAADLRTAAAEILGDVGDRRAVKALVSRIDDPDPNARAAAAEALGKIGGAEAVAALDASLGAPDMALQRAVLGALGRLRAPPSAGRLVELAKDRTLRRAVLRLAGESDEPPALALLARGLEDSSRTVREAALAGIARHRVRRAEALPGLIAAVRESAARVTETADVAAAALAADDVAVRGGALSILEWVGKPRHAPAIAAAAEDERLSAPAAEALAALGPAIAAVLAPELPRLAPLARAVALAALARLGEVRVPPASLAALARLGEARVPPALIAARLGPEPDRRGEAACPPRGHRRRDVASPARGSREDSPAMTQEESRLLRELIYEHCGLSFGDDMRYLLERRLAPRLQCHGLADFSGYYRFLRCDPGRRTELATAAEVLTTNETYFYREPHQLRAFSEEILPVLAEDRAGQRRVRIWSAGCSTGEEVYTIAVLLVRSGLFEGWNLEVFGSDIARRVLAVGRAGAYGPHAFRTPEAEAIRPWFRTEAGKWHAKDRIRNLVRFGHLNLLDDRAMGLVGPVDVIFCRNVMIYFDLAARKRVVQAFRERLREGGYLLLGHSESLLDVTADFELVQLRHDLVYRKPRR